MVIQYPKKGDDDWKEYSLALLKEYMQECLDCEIREKTRKDLLNGKDMSECMVCLIQKRKEARKVRWFW